MLKKMSLKKLINKRSISLALVLAMLLGMLPAYAYGEKKELKYLAIGASNTNGFGLDGYMQAVGKSFVDAKYKGNYTELGENEDLFDSNTYYKEPEWYRLNGNAGSGFNVEVGASYPVLISDLLSNYYNVKLYQYAQCGMRFEDLRFLIDDSYEGDSYTKWRFFSIVPDEQKNKKYYSDNEGNYYWGWFTDQEKLLEKQLKKSGSYQLPLLKGVYKDAIKEADIITVDLGSNSFGPYLLNSMFDSFLDPSKDMEQLLPSTLANARSEVIKMIKEAVGEDSSDTVDEVLKYLDSLTYAYASYKVNLAKCLDIIRKNNPTAQITVLGMDNLLEGYSLSYEGITVPVGKILGLMIGSANLFAKAYADTHFNCGYVSPAAAEIENIKTGFVNDYSSDFENESCSLDSLVLPQKVKDWLNIYDDNLMVGSRAYYLPISKSQRAAYESLISLGLYEELRDALESDFEYTKRVTEQVLARLLYDGLKSSNIDYGVATGAYKKFKDVFPGWNYPINEGGGSLYKQKTTDLVDEITFLAAERKTASYIYEQIPSLFEKYGFKDKDEISACLTFYCNLVMGNCIMLHPSENGHKALRNLILKSWAKDSNCLEFRLYAKKMLSYVEKSDYKVKEKRLNHKFCGI